MKKRYIFLFSALMTLGVLAYVALGILPYRLETAALGMIKQWNIHNSDEIKSKFKNGSLYFTNISFDDQGFSIIQRINVPYSWKDALNSGLSKMVIHGMHLTATLEEDGTIAVTGVENSKILAHLYNLPVTQIEFKNGKIDLFSKQLGGILINFNGEILRHEHGAQTLSFQIESTQKQFHFDAKASGQITGQQEAQIDLEILGAKWDLSPLKISRLSGTANLIFSPEPTRILNAQLTAGAANLYNIPWQDVNITIEQPDIQSPLTVYASSKALGQEDLEGGLTQRAGVLTGSLHAPSAPQIMDYLTQHGFSLFPKPPLWLNNIKSPTINFETKDKKTITVALVDEGRNMNINGSFLRQNDGVLEGKFTMEPALLGNVTDLFSHGTMTASGDFTQDKDADVVSGNMNIQFRDGVWRFGNWRFKDVNGVFAYENLQSPELAKPGMVTFTLPLRSDISQKASATVSHKIGKPPVIHDAQIAVFGGLLKTYKPDEQQALVNLSNINLKKLAAALRRNGLEMSGEMQGTLPLALEGKKIVIKNAVLRAQGKGVWKFAPAEMPAFLSGADLRREATRAALANYHYDDFEIKLNGDAAGEVDVILTAQGKNPDLFAGRPVAIDLRFKASLPAIFASILAE